MANPHVSAGWHLHLPETRHRYSDILLDSRHDSPRVDFNLHVNLKEVGDEVGDIARAKPNLVE